MEKMNKTGNVKKASRFRVLKGLKASNMKHRKVKKKSTGRTSSATTQTLEKMKKKVLSSYSRIFDSIKTNDTEAMKAEMKDVMKNVENSELVGKLESFLETFEEKMMEEGDKLVKKINKAVKASKRS